MPRPHLTPAPKKAQKHAKKNPPAPTTADEYLALGVSIEEAGEKWRAGDAIKAARFFVRAVECYDDGLARFGTSFDLAYNKARVQYQLAQSSPTPELLRIALASHRRALALDESNADVMFNTAQVLASLAEVVNDGQEASGDPSREAAQILDEAIGLFRRCLTRQELLYEQSIRQMSEVPVLEVEEPDPGDQGASSSGENEHAMEIDDDRWAVIVEPVTKLSLLDTLLALLDCLSTLSTVLTPSQPVALDAVEDLGRCLMVEKLPVYLEGGDSDASNCAWPTVAKFKAALLDCKFRFSQISAQMYDVNLKQIFEPAESEHQPVNMTRTSGFLSCYADALITFAGAVAGHSDLAVMRWTRLTKALDNLREATSLAGAEEIATIHVGRGDIEMLRLSLCGEGGLPANISNDDVQKTLLKNAETFYRGAAQVAQSSMRRSQDEIAVSANIKRAIVACLLTASGEPIAQLRTGGLPEQNITRVIREMVDESLVSKDMLQRAGIE